jgi:Thymidylate kinase
VPLVYRTLALRARLTAEHSRGGGSIERGGRFSMSAASMATADGVSGAGGGSSGGDGDAPRGTFILFEGVDRCGKTTQCDLLVRRLKEQGHKAVHMRFPGESAVCARWRRARAASHPRCWQPLVASTPAQRTAQLPLVKHSSTGPGHRCARPPVRMM